MEGQIDIHLYRLTKIYNAQPFENPSSLNQMLPKNCTVTNMHYTVSTETHQWKQIPTERCLQCILSTLILLILFFCAFCPMYIYHNNIFFVLGCNIQILSIDTLVEEAIKTFHENEIKIETNLIPQEAEVSVKQNEVSALHHSL